MSVDQAGRDAARELLSRTGARTDVFARRAALGRRARNRRRLHLVSAVVALLVVVAAAAWVRGLVQLDRAVPAHHLQRFTGNGAIVVGTSNGTVMVNPSSGERTPLPAGDLFLDWSPDGRRLAYTDGSGLFVHPLAGGKDRYVGVASSAVRNEGFLDGPLQFVWSDDGTTYTVKPTQALRHLPATVWAVTRASWSPDFSRIAFIGWPRSGHPELYVINADGSGLRRLPARAPADYGPTLVAWSPDGTKIAYAELGPLRDGRTSNNSFMTIDPDGTHRTRVGAAGQLDDIKNGPAPAVIWSPDSHSLAFLSDGVNGNRAFGLYVMTLDGHTRQLQVGAIRGFRLLWQPTR